jgi:hypothetical protein
MITERQDVLSAMPSLYDASPANIFICCWPRKCRSKKIGPRAIFGIEWLVGAKASEARQDQIEATALLDNR